MSLIFNIEMRFTLSRPRATSPGDLMRLRRLFVPLVVLIALPVPRAASANAPAQPTPPGSFSIRGTVRDPAGAPVAGARVTTRRDGVSGPSAATDRNGAFTLALNAGRYTIVVAAEGFAPVSQTIDVPSNSEGRREFVLPIAGV